MNLNFERLKLLKKEFETYLLYEEMGYTDNGFVKNEKVIEYECIRNNFELGIQNQFNTEAQSLLKKVNLRDFDLVSIRRELEMLGHSLWSRRTEDEILLTKFLDLDYSFFYCQYQNVKWFKELQQINIDRLKAKEEIKNILKDSFQMRFRNGFEQNKIAELNIINNERIFFECESIKEFTNRDNYTIERDCYGFINLEDYNRALRDGFSEAKIHAQAEIKKEFSYKVTEFINKRIATQEPPNYYFKLDIELDDFVTQSFKSRDTGTTLKESNLLVDLKTYGTWSRNILYEIRGEYETEDEDHELDFDESEYDFDNRNSGYEKYGGYNGYDDDTIDNAFEGDPENTWNVD